MYIQEEKFGSFEPMERRCERMDISKLLIKKYGLRPLLITKIRNRNVYKVHTTDKIYAFKVYDWPAAINFHITLLHQLDKNGFRQFPKVITTLDGSGSVEMGDMSYVLSEWIEGVQPSFSNIEHLKIASAFLALFHRAAKAPEQEVMKNVPNAFLYPTTFHDMQVGPYRIGVVKNRLNEWVKQFGTDPLRIALERMEYAEYFFPIDSYKELVTSERKENTFIHGDYNYSNLIFSPEGKVYLIDFDGSHYCVRISDLLSLCHLHMGENAEMLLDILKSYHRVRPLTLTEFEIVKNQLFVPGKIYWKMHLNSFYNNPIDKDWIIQNLARFSSKESFDTIKRLSYSDLL